MLRLAVDFSTAIGWTPAEGGSACALAYLPDDEKPVLVSTDHGLLIPLPGRVTRRA